MRFTHNFLPVLGKLGHELSSGDLHAGVVHELIQPGDKILDVTLGQGLLSLREALVIDKIYVEGLQSPLHGDVGLESHDRVLDLLLHPLNDIQGAGLPVQPLYIFKVDVVMGLGRHNQRGQGYQC